MLNPSGMCNRGSYTLSYIGAICSAVNVTRGYRISLTRLVAYLLSRLRPARVGIGH